MTTESSQVLTPSADQGRALRDTLGHFATGVTVVTTRDAAGQPAGMTVNSFNSVSLDPAMVLWSIDKQALGYQAFTGQEHFAVHVLKADQQHISNLFAGRGADKFGQVHWRTGPDGIPQLEGCAAYFHCRRVQCIDGGDHTILLGEVLEFTAGGGEPLVFHRGRYRALAGD
ncbi:flavin reductase family protein [Microbulbifer taiwanensis]|uniref:Flavin reductase family protein n=1 Tax=Microbulbifer taiwanensis TaxID=986746 RepID=A0ABW1YL20_9GAMM|nr:flavin reductase family protein [Microbulbifer taiwanensis]